MPLPNTLSRTAGFGVATLVTAAVGRVGFLQDTGLSLYWPAAGVIVFWALTIRTKIEYVGFLAIILVGLTALNLRTGFPPVEAVMLALANATLGLLTRRVAILMVPLGRRLGLSSRNTSGPTRTPANETIARMAAPYDVFRLFGATFVGASLAWFFPAMSLVMEGNSPTFVDGAVWVVRSLASVMVVAGTGLALMQKTDNHRRSSVCDVLFAFGVTTLLATTAHLMSPHIPLAMMVLLPLFWSGVRSRTSVAALHAVYTTVAILAMVAGSGGAVFGLEFNSLSMSVRLHLIIIVAFLIALVVATAVNEFVRLNADIAAVADTARRRASALRTITRTIPDALLTVDLRGRATPLNSSGKTFVRPGEDGTNRLIDWPGRRFSSHPDLTPSVRALGGETVVAEPFAYTDRAGTERMFELTAAPLLPEGSDEPERALLLIRDVSENHQILHELERLAESDPLTGLPNRRRFDKDLAEHVQKYGGVGGVLVLDLDGFKDINDTFGHAVGDDVLTDISRILSESVYDSDVLTRLGGDEFAILVPDADRERLEQIAGYLVNRIRDYARTLDGAGKALTASVGGATIASALAQGVDPLVAADRLMYDVKYSGRDGIVIVGDCENPEEREPTRYEWKVRLEQALANDELTLHLQPIVDVESGRITGAETLVRLVADGRLIPPSEFVPVAERSGLASALDAWVIKRAISTLARLRDLDPELSIWINVSAQSIGDEAVARTLLDSVAECGVPASAVVLELTETAKIDNVPAARSYASRLRAKGFRLAIDDFGTGFGSLIYLQNMLFDYVKIDGVFISSLDRSTTDRAIVHSLVDMARSLNMEVVAEHVGSTEILDVVRDEGIHYAQGFDIGRPCPEDEFADRFLPTS